MNQLVKLYVVILLLMLGGLYYTYNYAKDVPSKVSRNIENLFISQAKESAKNIDAFLKERVGSGMLAKLRNDPALHKELKGALSLLINPVYKYVFVLYRDKKGEYRFLLDGSKEECADLGERLQVNKAVWDKVYRTKKPYFIDQTKLGTLWMTYLYPIVYNGRVEAVLDIDFSVDFPQEIASTIRPVTKTFEYVLLAIVLMLLILVYQALLNFRSQKESITDPLTHIYNRNYLRKFLRHANMSYYQILMLDIDFFKKINDNYGHKTGDFVLASVANIIQEEIREEDVLIRYGGEEFLLFVKNNSQSEHLAKNVAERIRKKIAATEFDYEDASIHLTVSIGVNCYPQKYKSVAEAIKAADNMLYIAKKTGRNKVVVNSESHKEQDGLAMKSIYEIKEALEEGRIVNCFQPIYSLKENRISKYEALVRLQEKDGSLVLPVRFLGNIENTSVYNELTKRVIENVFAHIDSYGVRISINLNFSDIMDNVIFSIIIDELEKNKERASMLIVELLENEPIEEIETMNEKLTQIKSYGVRIAVDDFGSGYANYEIFKMLDVDIIKIDGSLIKDIENSEVSLKITRSVIALSKDLGLETVAEFVHSKEVYDIVKELEVDAVQGYYLARPSLEIKR